ncbi:MAG: hypothetical protein N2448_09605 [Caloramator sp.]|nr:hypothetical protein [Caloramator sp.]
MNFNEKGKVISLRRKRFKKKINKLIQFFDKLNLFLRENKNEKNKSNFKGYIAH